MNLWHPLSTDWTIRFGWTVLHSLWQGAIIAVALSIVLTILRHRAAQARYVAALIAMGMVLASAVLTFALTADLARQNATSDTPVLPATVANPSPASHTFIPPVQLRSVGQEEIPASGARDLSAHAIGWLTPALPFIAEAWAAGVLLLSVWNLGGWIAAQRLRVIGVHSPDQSIANVAQSLSRRLGLQKPVRLAISLISETPMVIGWIRPVLLLPAALLSGLTPKQIEGILAHELAHIRRHDYLINLLQVLAETLLFYHPAVWWISRRVRLEREQCCDEVAVALIEDRCAYAESLAALAELRFGGRLALAARGSGGSELVTRIRRLLGVHNGASPRSRRATTAAAAWFLAALAATAGLVIHGSAAIAPSVRPASAPATTPSGPPTVLLVTDGNYFLERAVSNSRFTADTLSPADYEQYLKLRHADANCVTIFDRWAPKVAPSGPAIYVDCIPPGSTLMVEKDGAGRFRNNKDEEVTEWPREHPALKGLELNRLFVAEALKLRVPADWESLARSKDGDLIVADRAGGKREIVVGFNVLQSNWPFEVSFPIFLHRSVLWLAGKNDPAADRTPDGAERPAPRLQFRLVASEAERDTEDMKDPDAGALLHVRRRVELDEFDVKAARVAKSPSGQLSVDMDFTPAGSKKLMALTSVNINKKLAIVFDGQVLMAATIRDKISGSLTLFGGSGGLTPQQAKSLVDAIGSVHETPDTAPAAATTQHAAGIRADCVLTALADGKRQILASPTLNLEDGIQTTFLFTGKPPVIIEQRVGLEKGIFGRVSAERQPDARLRIICRLRRQEGDAKAAQTDAIALTAEQKSLLELETELSAARRRYKDAEDYTDHKAERRPYTYQEIARVSPDFANKLMKVDQADNDFHFYLEHFSCW